MERLFVYGTLRDPKILKSVIGRGAENSPDILDGFRKVTITIFSEKYPVIIPSEESSVDGDVIDVSEDEFLMIDQHETKSYTKKKVKLKSGTIAWVYLRR